jgi:hypothetical protein
MALTPEDLELLGSFIDKKIAGAAPAASDRTAKVGTPDVDPEAGPLYWIHLADGSVLESHDSGSTHMLSGSGKTELVIGRFLKGE